MSVLDLRALPADAQITADVCVVGSGPAGATLAAELASRFDVVVVESGGAEPDPQTAALNETENVGVERVADHELVRTRAFGGTSRIWTGRCGVLSALDFQERSWVPHSGWPLSAGELDPYLERARPYLGLGPHVYDERLLGLLGRQRPQAPLADTLVAHFWQMSRSRGEPGLPTRFDRDVLPVDHPRVRILAHATATHVNTDPDGKVAQSIEVSTIDGRRARVLAKTFVICAGGLENARLLLASDRIVAGGVGNTHNLVGRFLMDHPGSVLATIPPALARPVRERFGRYWLDGPDGRHVYLGGVAISEKTQREEGLLNCAAFLEEYAARDDPWHAAQRLAGTLRGRPTPEDEIEQASFWRGDSGHPSRRTSTVGDITSIVRHGWSVAAGLHRMLRRRRPPLFRADRVHLYCLTEQVPDPESRITLSERRDELGVRRARIDWRIAEAERRSVRRLETLLSDALVARGNARPAREAWLDEESWRSGMTDRAHPMGTTRMATDPRRGVVDANCAVHGVHGLYMAGSSTFPTGGHVNPTLTVVALSIRLADHLKRAAVA